jgi:hypothetical protein
VGLQCLIHRSLDPLNPLTMKHFQALFFLLGFGVLFAGSAGQAAAPNIVLIFFVSTCTKP